MSGRRPADDAHGLSAQGDAIVTRLEAGAAPLAVARALGLGLSTVVVAQRRYIIGEKQLNGFERQCRASEARYRAALTATGKVFA